jgi:hypothetical protein
VLAGWIAYERKLTQRAARMADDVSAAANEPEAAE